MEQNKKKHAVQKSNLLVEEVFCSIPKIDGYRLTCIGMSQVCVNLLKNPDDAKALTASIKTKDLQNLFPTYKKAGNSVHRIIKKATNYIAKNTFLKDYKDEGNWEQIFIITKISYRNFNELQITFNPEIRKLFNTNDKFTRYLINDIAELSSYQRIRLYELCVQYMKIGYRAISLETLKEFLSIKKDKSNSDLIREIKTSIKQINKKTNLNVEFETIKTSRKITHLKFVMAYKKHSESLGVISDNANSLRTKLTNLGFKAEKVESLLQMPKEVLLHAINNTEKAKVKGFKKSMEACFFWQIKHFNKEGKAQINPGQTVYLFRESLSVADSNALWNEFFATLNPEQQETYTNANKCNNPTLKKALNDDFNKNMNAWIYNNKLQQQ